MLHYHNIITFPKEQVLPPNVKCLWITVKILKEFAKNNYDYQAWITKGRIDVKNKYGL